jgi:predicted dehydrogenase
VVVNHPGVGIIGLGFIGHAHAEALRRLGIPVLAVASRDRDRAREKANAIGAQRAYGDWRELIADQDISVVHVCSPNSSHAEMNEAAILAGKHVISEKPLAITLSQGRHLAHLAEAHPEQVLAVAFNYRAYPLVQLARTMIRRGELGRPHLIHGSYLQDWLLYQSDYNWRLNSAVGGKSRAMADIGSHWCDLIEYLTGDRIQQLCAQYQRIYDVRTGGRDNGETFAATGGAQSIPVDTEDMALVHMRFASGAVGSTIMSQVSAGRKNRLLFEIDCAEGSVEWNQEHPERLWIGRRNRPNEEVVRDPAILPEAIRGSTVYPAGHPEGWPDALTAMLRAVYADMGKPAQARHPWYATFADGARALAVVSAATESEGRWIVVPRFIVGNSLSVDGEA